MFWSGLLLTLLVVVSIALIAVILLQRSEGGALGMGGGGGGGFLTARGTGDLLTRSTSILGAAFFILAMSMVFVSGGGRPTGSVTDRVTIEDIDPTAAPATTPPAPPAGIQAPAPGLQQPLALPGQPLPETPSGLQAPAPAPQTPPAQ